MKSRNFATKVDVGQGGRL